MERRDTQIMDKWWLLTRIFGRIFRKTKNERGILVAVFTYSIIVFKTNLDDMSIFEMFQTKIVTQTYPLSSQPQGRVSVKKCKKCTNIIRYDNNNNIFMILVHVSVNFFWIFYIFVQRQAPVIVHDLWLSSWSGLKQMRP